MAELAATIEARQRHSFKGWEWLLLLLATPVLVASLAMYVNDFPILRKYILRMEQTTAPGVRVGRLFEATGTVRRQRADEAEFVAIPLNEPLENEDTVVTDPGVRATVLLDDGGRIELSPDTMVRLAFDTGISIGGIVRQAKIQLVTGAVSGQTREQKIVVRTVTGKTATIGSDAGEKVVTEAAVVPQRIEMVATAVPLEVIEERVPPPIEIPSSPKKEEAPPPTPVSKIQPAMLSALSPLSGARLAPSSGSADGSLPMTLSFQSSRADARFRVRLQARGSWLGGTLLDERVEARAGKVSLPVTLQKPGAYEWSVEDLDADAALGSNSFEVTPEFDGLTLLEASVPGTDAMNNTLGSSVVPRFPGILLRWNSNPNADGYEVRVYGDAPNGAPLFSETVSEPQMLFSQGRITTARHTFRVTANLKNGFRAHSPPGRFQFAFLPPPLMQPENGAAFAAKPPKRSPVLLTWRHTNFTQKYEVQLSSDRSFSRILEAQSTEENFHSFQPKTPGIYYWRVRSIAADVTSAFTTTRNFTVR